MMKFLTALIICGAMALAPGNSEATRLKDLTHVFGVRDNQLIGYGVVVGLAGTGDLSTNIFFNVQSVIAMLQKMGVKLPATEVDSLKTKNTASVIVTATLPPFAKTGSRIDILVSSMGDCKSLQGGTLLMTPLRAANGEVYAVGQGPVSIGGFAAGRAAAGVQKNHLNAGNIAGGALIEKTVDFNFQGRKFVKLILKSEDFTTAMRIVRKINMNFGEPVAKAQDAGTVMVKIPENFKENSVQFVAMMENIDVTPDVRARVVMAEKTGTIVMGANVRISTVAISHGNLAIQIKEPKIPPAPVPGAAPGLSATAIVPRNRVTGQKGEDRILMLPQGNNIGAVVTALNAIGVKPKDLIAILQAIKAAGALQAELVVL